MNASRRLRCTGPNVRVPLHHRLATCVLAGALVLSAPACAGSEPVASSAAPEGSRPPVLERPEGPVDELIQVDGKRMHLRCTGSGEATVLLLAGWDEDGTSWSVVETALAARTRVCSYSRFGTGRSDGPEGPQTFETQATDLRELLTTAGEPGPYVVVGHSFGGAEAVTFAVRYGDQVIGLALVDASPPTWPETVCSVPQWVPLCAVMRDPAGSGERLDVFPAFEEVAEITSLGDLPMTVITATHRTDPSLSPQELEVLDVAWLDGVERWASLSTASTVVPVQDTGHHIQLDQPRVVIDAILDLLP